MKQLESHYYLKKSLHWKNRSPLRYVQRRQNVIHIYYVIIERTLTVFIKLIKVIPTLIDLLVKKLAIIHNFPKEFVGDASLIINSGNAQHLTLFLGDAELRGTITIVLVQRLKKKSLYAIEQSTMHMLENDSPESLDVNTIHIDDVFLVSEVGLLDQLDSMSHLQVSIVNRNIITYIGTGSKYNLLPAKLVYYF